VKFIEIQPSNRCAQCGNYLVAPDWTEFLNERCIRHLWSCDSCAYAFETKVYFPHSSQSSDLDAAA
jgi:ribosomal protein L37AE/L43A